MPLDAHSPSSGACETVGPIHSSAPLLTPVDIDQTMQLNDLSETSFLSAKQRDDKLPHDASVFVGSLPSNMDQGDLTRMLMEHLSEYTQIKNIKVVRDSKGGVCAFVQCENAISATSLIQTLHSSAPRPFLGRLLRYEPARAFRSLLVSYRTPTQFGHPTPGVISTTSFPGHIELELPTAMRIWKHRNSRFHSILYNSEAVQAEEKVISGTADAPDNTVFLNPLHFDEESLCKLASYFGPLEFFTPLEAAENEDEECSVPRHISYSSYPEPHRFSRSPSMANICWEIKWEHRDDCVSALMTLRRVPHLTVTWAHQPTPSMQGAPTNHHQSPTSLSYSPQRFHRSKANESFAAQRIPVPLYNFIKRSDEDLEKPDARQSGPSPPESPKNQDQLESAYFLWDNTSTTAAGRKVVEIASLPLNQQSPQSDKKPAGSENLDIGQKHAREPSADFNDRIDPEDQELYIPQTPGLDASSITPATPGSHFPITPTDLGLNISQTVPRKSPEFKNLYDGSNGSGAQKEIDPTTLFVGGLEMFGPGAWDEEKVKTFFSRFGGLECVKVVRPLNACAAFAFVKFNNTEAPARAVFEEHNRIYEGRAMRVQLRDCNPPRNTWKFNRGRGRPHQHHFNVQRRFHHRPSFPGQERPPFSMDQENLHLKNSASFVQELPAVIRIPREEGSSNSGCHDSSLLNVSQVSRNSPSDGENYREWYDDAESSVHTPEPSSLGSSASTTGVTFSASPSYGYPIANGPYFPQPPWINSYPTHVPYQIPFYPGYPVYPPAAVQQQQQSFATPPGSDANGPVGGTQHNWSSIGMYTSYIPYPSIPPRTQLVEQGQQASHLPTQAPVVPTGFIQNEQGTLIAVYPPDALDQYLAGAVQTMSMAPNYLVSNQQRWEYTNSHHGPGPTSATTFPGQQNRPKSAGFPPPPSQQLTTPHRETDANNIANTNVPLYRRQNSLRRETQQSHGFVRQHNHSRPSHNGRSTRAHMHYPANVLTSDLGHHIIPPAGDWNR